MRSIRTIIWRKSSLSIGAFLILAIAAIICFICLDATKTQAASVNASYKYYTSIQIQPGDTLWKIAKEYISSEYHCTNDYIEEVCRMNHLSDYKIHSGQYLTIPYYSSEYIE